MFADRITSSTSYSTWRPETCRPVPLGMFSVTVFKVATLPAKALRTGLESRLKRSQRIDRDRTSDIAAAAS
jgi:hypothetical protein